MNPKAVSLLSGGLDSTLATKVVLNQDVEVVGLHFSMPWGCCDRSAAYAAAKLLGIPMMIFRMKEDYLDVIRNPRYGYGRAMNPCVDCRIHMYRKAKVFMESIGASFLITGEVLGQRPKSQMMDSLKTIERDTALKRRILRPLSAHLLEPTLAEEAGVIDRSKLLAISGRSRKIQMALAEEEGIRDYPSPAGGCLLTDEHFSKRVRDLFDHADSPTVEDMELLRVGRHFRLHPVAKLIVGRNESENDLLAHYGTGRFLFHPVNFPGPSVLVAGELRPEDEQVIASFIFRYGSSPDNGRTREVILARKRGTERDERRFPAETLLQKERLEPMRI